MTVNLDDMTVKQLRKHAKDVAKALLRKETVRAKKLRKEVMSYTQELGENIGGFFGKKTTIKNESPSTKSVPAKTKNSKPPSSKAILIKTEASKPPKYIEPDGTPRQRMGKWSEKYTKKQLESMKQK